MRLLKYLKNISNDNYDNGVNNNANMHQLLKLSTIQKNKQFQTIKSQEQHMCNTQAKLLTQECLL